MLDGLAFYEGYVIRIPDPADRTQELARCLENVMQTKELLEHAHIPIGIVSSGGTLTYSTTGHYPGISEIRPGGYALMDLNYRPFTSDFDCALTVLGTVVSTPGRNRVIIDAGSTSVAKENVPSIQIRPEGRKLAWLQESRLFDVTIAYIGYLTIVELSGAHSNRSMSWLIV